MQVGEEVQGVAEGAASYPEDAALREEVPEEGSVLLEAGVEVEDSRPVAVERLGEAAEVDSGDEDIKSVRPMHERRYWR